MNPYIFPYRILIKANDGLSKNVGKLISWNKSLSLYLCYNMAALLKSYIVKNVKAFKKLQVCVCFNGVWNKNYGDYIKIVLY